MMLGRLVATGVAALGLVATTMGQASYVESFDDIGETNYSTPGPQALIARGWVFRNQSQPVGSRAYFSGVLPSTNPSFFGPQAGAHYLAVDGASTDTISGGQFSAWAILPAISNQRAGDAVTVWLRRTGGEAGIEVRYSPSGGTSTGSGATAIGDFTQTVISANPAPDTGWVRFQGNVPGPGRLAIRLVGASQGLGSFLPYVGIDTLSVGVPPPPPCNLPLIPQPGQTVTWTAAAGPYRVCQNITIPAGATVNVEPGVRVDFDSGFQLFVSGTMNVLGTSTGRVAFDAPAVYPPFIVVQNGALNAAATDFGQQLRVAGGANVRLTGCTFVGDGTNLDGAMLISDDIPSPQPFVVLDGCRFDRSNMTLSGCLATLRNNTFVDSYALILRGYADVTSPNTFIGRALQIDRQETTQPLYVDGVSATGVPDGGGLSVAGGGFLLGAGNTLQGNRYALDLRGGLMPGSTLPAAGNTDNVINVFEAGFAGEGRWLNLGLPYRITEPSGQLPGGDITMEPGITVEGLPGTSLLVRSTRRVITEGLPQAPITFRNAPGQGTWGGLAWVTNGTSGPRMEYCNVSGAQIGVVSSDNFLYVDNCAFIGNSRAAGTGTGTIWFAKSLFQNNTLGASGNVRFLSFTNFNAFENNGTAVAGGSNPIEANNVWWNSPTGPRHPQNPAGTGDLIGGPSPNSVSIVPFLTSRPDFADTPPVVRILEPGFAWNASASRTDFVAEPGTKFILRWEAQDNAGIVNQRVVLSPDGHYPDRFTFTLADNLPSTQRSLEITVPVVGFAVTNQPQFIKVIATDAQGQEGFDHTPMSIPSGRLTGNLTITSDAAFVGRTFRAGDAIPDITWTGTVSDLPSIDAFIVLESDGRTIGAVTIGSTAHFSSVFPNISTDTARVMLRARNNSNDQKWFFSSGYFSIRHDPRLAMSPPLVQITGPAAGASFPGGSAMPMTWTASAEQGLFGFDIQASTDGGRFWHLVARDLPGAARSYDWQLPPSQQGIADVQVRVIARDIRFQNSTASRTVAITPGVGQPCYANCDGSMARPILNVNDFVCFLNRYSSGDAYANCDSSTTPPILNVNDFACFLNRYAAGCP